MKYVWHSDLLAITFEPLQLSTKFSLRMTYLYSTTDNIKLGKSSQKMLKTVGIYTSRNEIFGPHGGLLGCDTVSLYVGISVFEEHTTAIFSVKA